ncbi:leucine-rich repeat protein [Alloprevotella rava]
MEKIKFVFLMLLLSISVGLKAQTVSGTYSDEYGRWNYSIRTNNEAQITGGSPHLGILKIPASVEHSGRTYPVRSIGVGAFSDNSLIGEIILPNGIKEIEDYAFSSCPEVYSINIPSNLERIGICAFYQSPKITGSLTFPHSFKELGASSFIGTSLTSVTFLNPIAISESSRAAFSSCESLISISLPEGVTCIPEGFVSSCERLTSFNIPSTVRTIGKGAFHKTGLTSISIPEGVTKIEESTFKDCKALAGNIVIPSTVTSIDKEAFSGCEKITSITGFPATQTEVPDNLFNGCKNLTRIDGLSYSQLTTVGEKAFNDCEKLTGLNPLPATLTAIGKSGYAGCKAMVGTLTIPNTITKIEEATFKNCAGLTGNLTLENKEIVSEAFLGCTGLNGTLTVKNCTFTGPTPYSIKNQFAATQFHHLDTDAATLPLINGSLFDIKDLDNSSSNNYNYPPMTFDESLITGMNSIPDNFLKDMPQLVGKITFSPSLTSIGNNAFDHCGLTANLKTIPAATTIGNSVFRLCPNITTDAVIPDNYPMSPYTSPDNVFPELPYPNTIGEYRALPYIYSGITSMDLGNLPFYFFRGGKTPWQIGSIWVNKNWGVESPNLLWVDARRCQLSYEGGSNNFLKWTFVRNWDATPVNYYYHYFNFRGLKVNALVYLPSESNFVAPTLADDPTFDQRFDTDENDDETGGNSSNFIMDGKCKQFFVKDGLPYRVPFPFTAQTARYSRTFNVTTGKAVSTLYLPYPTDLPAGMCAYTLVKKNLHDDGEKTFVFREVPQGTRLSANKPYLVRITDGQPHKLPVMCNVEVPASLAVDAAGQIGIEDTDWKFFGTTEKIDNTAAVAKKAYYLNGNKWWAVQNGVENDYIAPFRCFISSPTGAAAARSFLLVLEGDDDGNVTGIKQLENDTEKDIHSGKYPFYSVDGKLMGKDYNKLERGQIYIVNGKKFYKF